MARAILVKKARKDIPNTEIKAGDSYYWWKFKFGGKHYSKTPPTRSQLTSSEFLSTIYDIVDNTLGGLNNTEMSAEEIKSEIDNAIGELQNLREETEEKFNNMPEQLQESSDSGNTLQERMEALDSMISDLENIDTDVDEEKEENETDEAYTERMENRRQEIIDDAEGISYDGP